MVLSTKVLSINVYCTLEFQALGSFYELLRSNSTNLISSPRQDISTRRESGGVAGVFFLQTCRRPPPPTAALRLAGAGCCCRGPPLRHHPSHLRSSVPFEVTSAVHPRVRRRLDRPTLIRRRCSPPSLHHPAGVPPLPRRAAPPLGLAAISTATTACYPATSELPLGPVNIGNTEPPQPRTLKDRWRSPEVEKRGRCRREKVRVYGGEFTLECSIAIPNIIGNWNPD